MVFASKGFDHLIRKGRIPRTKNEQKRRFALIQHAEKIVKNPRAKILFRQKEAKRKVNRHGETIILKSITSFWTFVQRINNCKVKVVIAQFRKGGPKQFVSIMRDNVKITQGPLSLNGEEEETKKPA